MGEYISSFDYNPAQSHLLPVFDLVWKTPGNAKSMPLKQYYGHLETGKL